VGVSCSLSAGLDVSADSDDQAEDLDSKAAKDEGSSRGRRREKYE
jgi:hypothetical protein